MNNPSHNASTSCFFARLPFTSVHGKLVSKVPQRAVHAGKIVQGRTACVNGFGDDVLDVAREFNQALGGRPVFSHQATGVPSWRNAGPVQGFANVDVAHANHRFLVEKGQFDGRFSALQTSGEVVGSPRVKRFGAKRCEELVRGLLFGGKQVDDAKAPRVGIDGS